MRRRGWLLSVVAVTGLLLGGCSGERAAEDPGDGAGTTSSSPAGSAPSGSDSGQGAPGPSGAGTGESAPGEEFRDDAPGSTTALVNKAAPLEPLDWAPEDLVGVEGVQLRAEAARAAEEMIAAAGRDGVGFTLISGYRSYADQERTYSSWVSAQGQEGADTASARPGHSEHQTGLAADIGENGGCDLQVCFAETASADWVAEHAEEHGFIVRYPWMEHETTGYWYEPWHLRYVGEEAAEAYAASEAPNYEEFLGAEAAPDYP
ncbi:M15 family metallopeptidase [Rothia halotolerans]|uniref:M15 family metallopeptidase n=1 Tax=Rothia halotolerans TaxID=405770 RepID=UPI00101C0A8B|nr:M15 family metallopeptidase [Rothia halotolerans]